MSVSRTKSPAIAGDFVSFEDYSRSPKSSQAIILNFHQHKRAELSFLWGDFSYIP